MTEPQKKPRAKPSYYAVTHYEETSWYDRSGQQRYGADWYIVAGPCETSEQARAQGQEKIGPIFNEYGMSDIYQETMQKNLDIVPKSSLYKYRLDPDALDL